MVTNGKDEMLLAAEGCVATASKHGAQQCAARAYRVRDVTVQWRDGKLEQINEATTRGVGLQLYVDGRYAAVSSSDLRPEALDSFIAESIVMTRSLVKDPFRSLADPKLYAETVRRIKEKSDIITMPTLGAWWLPSPEARIAHIVEMAKDPMTKPDFGPIDMATSNVDTYDPKGKRFKTNETVYLNTTKTWQYFAETMKSVGVKPITALWSIPSIRATQGPDQSVHVTSDPVSDLLPGIRVAMNCDLSMVCA
jgi:hypothetical protein